MLGAEHPSTLTNVANLALTYKGEVRWKEAVELEVQVMEASEEGVDTAATPCKVLLRTFLCAYIELNK